MKPGEIYVCLLKYLTRKSLVKWIILSLIVSKAESVFDVIILRMEQKYVFTKLFFLPNKLGKYSNYLLFILLTTV